VATLNALSRTVATLNQARFVTDLHVQLVDGNQVVSLCWYARVPFVGHLISYIFYYLYDGKPIQAAVAKLLDKYQQNLNQDVAKVLQEETHADEIYQVSLKLGECFDQFVALTSQPLLKKSLNYEEVFPRAVTGPRGTVAGDLGALCVRVDNLKRAMKFERQAQDTTLHAHLESTLQGIETAFKNILRSFIKEGATDENLAITQIGAIYQELVGVRSQFGIAFDPAHDWLEVERTTFWGPTAMLGKGAKNNVDEGEVKAAFRMSKLASHALAWENLSRSLHPHLCEFVEEYRARFKMSLLDFCTSCWRTEDFLKIKRSYQKIETIISQTYAVGKTLKMPRQTRYLLFDLENLIAPATFSAARFSLNNVSEDRDALGIMARLHRLIQEIQPKLSGPSRAIAHRILDIAEKYQALVEKEKSVGKTVAELKISVEELQAKVNQLNEMERYSQAEELLPQVQRYNRQVAVFAPFAPHLRRPLTAILLDLQKKCDFASFTEEGREKVVQEMTYQEMTDLVKKYPNASGIVEKVRASRAPQMMASMLKSLSKQLVDYQSKLEAGIQKEQDKLQTDETLTAKDKNRLLYEKGAPERLKIVKDKLLQMEQEATTQVPPQNLDQTLHYLHTQQEALLLILAIADPSFIYAIQLPCTSFYVEGKEIRSWDYESIGANCPCSIHQTLQKSYFSSQYYALMQYPQEFDSYVEVKEIFDVLVEHDLVKAANFLLLMSTRPEVRRARVTPFLLRLQDATTLDGKPFAKLSSYFRKQELLNLAARLLPDTSAAELAEEVTLFQGKSWEEVDQTIISSFTFDPKKQHTPENVKLRDAAGWMMENPYFQQKYPQLAAHSRKVYEQLVPNILDFLPQDVITQIFAYVHGEEVKVVSKGWNARFAISAAALVPYRFGVFAGHLQQQLITKCNDELEAAKSMGLLMLDELQVLKQKKVAKIPSTVEESKLYLNEQLHDLVKIFAKMPSSVTKQMCIVEFDTSHILFGRPSNIDLSPLSCLVARSFKESRAWHWYHTTIGGPKRPKPKIYQGSGLPDFVHSTKRVKNRLLRIAEKNPEAVLDWIVQTPMTITYSGERKAWKEFIQGLVQLSGEKYPQEQDPFAIFKNSEKKDVFLQSHLDGAKDVPLDLPLAPHKVPIAIESIQNVTIKEDVMLKLAMRLAEEYYFGPDHVEPDDSANENEVLFCFLCQKIHDSGLALKSKFIAKVALQIAPGEMLAGRSATQWATTIPDTTIREKTLHQIATTLFQNAKNLPDIIQIFEFVQDRSSLAQEMVNFIDQKMFELANPHALLHYIADEPLRKTAETLLNVRLVPQSTEKREKV
jgi:hypothetical protein